MSEQASLFEQRAHAHLRLTAAIEPGARQPRSSGFGGSTQYSNRGAHARQIADQVARVKATHQRRDAVLGIDPELILVLETNGPLDPAAIERAGLTPLEIRSDRTLIAFAADPDLAEFLARNSKYQEGTRGLTERGNERRAQYEDLFDRIDLIRTIADADIIGNELGELLSDPTALQVVHRLEVHCWCPEDAAEARRRNDEVVDAIKRSGGRIRHTSIRTTVGWSVICCEVLLGEVDAILSSGRISWLNVMPLPLLDAPQLINATSDSLPLVVGPPADGPIVAIIDSGIRSAHPFLAPAVIGVEVAGPGLGDGGDESGHGTLVASIALHGSMEGRLASRQPLIAAGRLLSVRVLDAHDRFSDVTAWPDTLQDALDIAVAAGARVINLSLGDERRPYQPPRPSAVAAMIDSFVRTHPNIVVVTCAGNASARWHAPDRLLSNTYVEDMLNRPAGGVLDPGTAALALTVGGLGAGAGQGIDVTPSAEKLPVGGPAMPSPFSRVGPGPMGSIKPELSAPAGSVVVDTLLGRVADDRSVQIVGAGGAQPDRLLAVSNGTSFAAPLVSHAALRVMARYPDINGNSVRALVLIGTEPIGSFMEPESAATRTAQRRLVGYGRLSAERSESSGDHRVVLLSQAALKVDQVHFYSVPVPGSFRQAGGTRSLTVALAFDPPVRVTRLDYLANRMSFQVFHGPTVAEVRTAYVKAEEASELDDDVDATPVSIRESQLNLQPSDQERSRGTNQLARITRSTKVAADKPDEYVIAVRNMNRWDTPAATQNYSLAIALERDELHGELYAELSVGLEALVAEVEVEVEV